MHLRMHGIFAYFHLLEDIRIFLDDATVIVVQCGLVCVLHLLMQGILSEYFWEGGNCQNICRFLSLRISLDAAVIVVRCGLVAGIC